MTLRKPVALIATLSLAAAAAVGSLQPPASKPAQPDKAPATKPMEKMEISGQAMPQVVQPGPEHKRIEKLAGDWTVVTKIEMKGAPATESTEAMTVKSTLGGRFVQESGTGAGADKVESFKMWGYNAGSKKYEGIWTWTRSTGFLYVSGESPDAGKTINWKAWFDDDHTGKRVEFKIKTTFADEDHFTVAIEGVKMDNGMEGPTMTSAYTRKK